MPASEYTYGEQPWAFMSFGGESVDTPFYEFLADSHATIRFLLDVNAVELAEDISIEAAVPTFSELTYAEFPGGDVVLGARRFFFSDGVWVGKPSDVSRPNTTAEARIVEVADIQRVVPLFPESERRSEILVGEFTLANSDGGLDELASNYSIAGRPVRLYIGRPRYSFAEFRQVAELFGLDTEGDTQELRIKVQSAEDYLDTPLQTQRYSGLGGSGGDPILDGRLRPFCIGECFNVTPVLVNQDQWIYQVHSGSIYGIDAVKERGLALEFQEDVTTFQDLRTTDVDPGYYVTAKNLGYIKLGLGASGPEGHITVDVKGEAAGGYVNTVGSVLLRLATRNAKLPSSYLDLNSFMGTEMNIGPLGFYADGSEEYSVANIFNALLRPLNGWYGSTRERLIKIARLRQPENFEPVLTFSDNLLSIDELELNPPARYEQSLIYRKNWTVMGAGDISDVVDSDDRQELQSPGFTVTRSSAEAKIRHLTAISGGSFDSYFADQTLAQDFVDSILSLHRETRRLFRARITREALRLNLGEVVKLYVPSARGNRFFGASGKNFLVISTRMSGTEGHVELTLWG